jgi:hypothetical protein
MYLRQSPFPVNFPVGFVFRVPSARHLTVVTVTLDQNTLSVTVHRHAPTVTSVAAFAECAERDAVEV